MNWNFCERLEQRRLLAAIGGSVTADGALLAQPNRTVYLDLNRDGRPNDEPTVQTDGEGAYQFDNLAAGTYRVALDIRPSIKASMPVMGFYEVTVADTQTSLGNNFILTHAYEQPSPLDHATIPTAINLGKITGPVTVDTYWALHADRQMFRFDVQAGQAVKFDLDSEGGHFLALFDATGKPLLEQSGGGTRENAQYTFTTDGTFYLGVSTSRNTLYDPFSPNGSFGFNGGFLGDYALTITPQNTAPVEPPPPTNPSDTTPRIHSDFDGDGRPDVLLHNSQTGATELWLMNGTIRKSVVNLPTFGDKNWRLAAIGDFDNDGDQDILWQNAADNRNSVMFMNSTAVDSFKGMAYARNLNWKIMAAGDFDADGQTDLAWQNLARGACTFWLMNSTNIKGFKAFGVLADPTYRLSAAADFNADGKLDLIFRKLNTPLIRQWLMNNTAVRSFVSFPNFITADQQIRGAADYEGDDEPELILWNRTSGQLRVMARNENLPTTTIFSDQRGPEWDVLG